MVFIVMTDVITNFKLLMVELLVTIVHFSNLINFDSIHYTNNVYLLECMPTI